MSHHDPAKDAYERDMFLGKATIQRMEKYYLLFWEIGRFYERVSLTKNTLMDHRNGQEFALRYADERTRDMLLHSDGKEYSSSYRLMISFREGLGLPPLALVCVVSKAKDEPKRLKEESLNYKVR